MSPQNLDFAQNSKIPVTGTNVVISGISGLYPKSKNIKEFSDILYNQINPVTSEDCRWEFKHPEISNFSGKLPSVNRFDAQFFKVHYRQAHAMDPMSRMVLEQSYQAIYDAGINPGFIKNKKVGVFLSSALAENENYGFFDATSRTGFGITGSSKTMFANRISYWLDVKGPSLTYDVDSTGSFEALQQACSAIRRGECEAAIVGGVNLCMLPQTMINAKRCYALAPDGKTKSFDENADGCAKSEAISVLFLQKANDALRVYGEIVHVKTEFISKLSCETGQMFGFYRDPNTTADFLKQFYKEANVSPQTVEYIEAFGSANPEVDKAELQAIEEVFCGNRSDLLLVGSVTSNIGLTDAASGVTAVTKVLLGYHNGKIAGNLHCDTPRRDITGLREGRMQIVKEHQKTKYGYIGVNGMSVTGLNSHALLRGHFKPKNISRYTSSFPRLVTITARQEQFLHAIFEDLKSRPIDPEELALLHNIHSSSISGHLGRGYIILDTDEDHKTKVLSQVAEYKDDRQRPLWFVYSGMGSQWTGMGTHLMRIPIFAAAIHRCDKVLKPKGIDIVDILTSNDKTIYDNILHSFLGIAAVQIGLTDVLTAIGIKPDNIIGHSVGELGCAYADGCLTADEMILSAYARGTVSNECIKTRGAMAAVGLGYDEIVSQCPPEVDIACHNSSESCTISGPELIIREFTEKLSAAGVFAKEVPCANIAYHSRYIAEAGVFLKAYMQQIIRTPKRRSDKWLSTSVPQEKWNETANKYCSADYMTNNLLNSVLFEETSKLVPSNAVLVEIAPHGLLQAILKRSLSSCTNIPLTKRGHKDNATFLLDAVGKLFVEGFYPNVQALYPMVEFPVSTGTPHLSHLVEWMHEEIWALACKYEGQKAKKSTSSEFRITVHDDEYGYLKGNQIQGHILFPFAGALLAVWDTLLMTLGLSKKQFPVQFRDVHLYTQPILHDQRQVKLNVSLQRISGKFEVMHEKSIIATGFISLINDPNLEEEEIILNQNFQPLNIRSGEIYQKLSTQGYSYRYDFQSIYSVNDQLTKAQILWKDNWVTLIDGLLQLNVLKQNHSGVSKPTQISSITIDLAKHKRHLRKISSDVTIIDSEVDDIFNTTKCGGIVIQNIQFEKESPEILNQLSFKLYSQSDFTKDINHNINTKTDINFEGTLIKSNPMTLKINGILNLDSLHWEEVHEPTNINIKVHFAGVNSRHLNRATGIISSQSDDDRYGSDFSGTIEKNGDRIMGLLKDGTISTVLGTVPEMSWPVPKHWTLEDAATVPLAFAQAIYCLFIKSDLRGHHTVLIHGGAGDLGQAALCISLALGCTVFTTVSDKAEKQFLLNMFPQLKENHIASSRNNCYDMVLSATSGRGCDLVLNCVKENLKKTDCLKCVAFLGVALDTAQIEYREKFVYGMFNMTQSRSYKTIDLGSLFDPRNASELKKIHNLITEGISRGWVRPLSRVTYEAHEVSRAFRLLAINQHRGRVLLQLTQTINPVHSRITCDLANSHLILWDGDSFGLQFVEKLISRGATNILIHCTDPAANYQLRLRSWNNLGVNVQIVFDKLSNFEDITTTIAKAQEMGPLQGIYIGTKTKFVNEVSTILNRSEKSITELCPTLKYSAIIAVYDKIENKPNIGFIKNKFPLAVVCLPDLVKVNSEVGTVVDECSWINAAMDATEQAICSGYPVVNMCPELIQQTILTQQVARILSADKARAFINGNQTLEELKVQSVTLEIIRKCLERTIHVSLADNDLITLNKDEINNMESNVKYTKSVKEERGLAALFSYVDSDELRSTVDVVVMDTLVADTAAMGKELDVDATYLCVIPGMEGHHERFRGLCERLKISALALQPGLDHLYETPQQLAFRYSKVLLNKMGIKNRFILLGYESGVEVALELAIILEEKGLTGTVFCIGDDPERFREQIKEILKEYRSEEALRLGVVQHMFSLMSGGKRVEEVSLKGQTWDQSIDTLRRQLKCVSQSAQYVRATINAAYSRLVAFRTHVPTSPRALQSKIILLRTSNKPSPVSTALKNYSSPQLVVYDLAVPFNRAANDLRCAAIINRHLPKDILDTFDKSNRCTLYTIETK